MLILELNKSFFYNSILSIISLLLLSPNLSIAQTECSSLTNESHSIKHNKYQQLDHHLKIDLQTLAKTPKTRELRPISAANVTGVYKMDYIPTHLVRAMLPKGLELIGPNKNNKFYPVIFSFTRISNGEFLNEKMSNLNYQKSPKNWTNFLDKESLGDNLVNSLYQISQLWMPGLDATIDSLKQPQDYNENILFIPQVGVAGRTSSYTFMADIHLNYRNAQLVGKWFGHPKRLLDTDMYLTEKNKVTAISKNQQGDYLSNFSGVVENKSKIQYNLGILSYISENILNMNHISVRDNTLITQEFTSTNIKSIPISNDKLSWTTQNGSDITLDSGLKSGSFFIDQHWTLSHPRVLGGVDNNL